MSKININTMRELRASKARFFSITLLLALSVFIFVGLKAATPDMQQTMRNIYDESNLADAQLKNPLGFSGHEIEAIRNNTSVKSVGKSFETTVSTSNGKYVFNIISNPKKISKLIITKGHLPKKRNEIILGEQFKSSYSIGQKIKIKRNDKLKLTQYKIVGFATSSVYMKKNNLGNTNLGSGQIDGFAGVSQSAFSKSDPTVLQIKFSKLEGKAYQDKYEITLRDKVSQLQKVLNKLSQQRKKNLLTSINNKINQAQTAQTTLSQQRVLATNPTMISVLDTKQDELLKQIGYAKSQKNTINQLEYIAQSRGQFSVGYSDMGSDANRIKELANTFPIFFFAVALMVSFTVMRRMVEEKRIEIGTLKGLGYSNSKISSQFYLYAFLALMM